MEYAAAASHASAAAPLADPQHAHYPHPYAGYPYPYYQPAPATDPSATAAVAASSSYYYPVAAAAPASTAAAAASYDPYSAYQYYAPPAGAAEAGAGGTGLAGYYFTAGEASHQAAVAPGTHQAAAVVTGKDAGKHLGFDPQRYAQVAAARATNGMAPVSTPGMQHAQWNAHFGHPLPKNVLRKHIKKKPKVVEPAPCEVCKIQCDTLEVLLIHKQGKKHKKNLEKLQDSITPKPIKPPSNAIGPTMAPAVANAMMPVVQQKKKKCSSAATPEELEVKKRRVLEAGAAQGEMKICNVCNVVVNSQKVYEGHIAGQKHQAMVQKQQAIQFVA